MSQLLSSQNLSLDLPKVHQGFDSSAGVADAVRALGHDRAFIVTDKGVVNAGVLDAVVKHLGSFEHTVFDGVEPNPTDLNVDEGTAALRAFGPAVVVLLGGGSVMDAGKCIALAAPNDGRGIDYCLPVQATPEGTIDFSTLAPKAFASAGAYPTLAIPTTSGTASETNAGGLITDTSTGRKLVFSAAGAKPATTILDPGLTMGLPPYVTATCGMDVLTHAIEAICSTNANVWSTAVALGAIEIVERWLPVAVADGSDREARAQMQLASHMAGQAFSNGPLLGLVHAMGHPISARLHKAHGQTLATLLPTILTFNTETSAAELARVSFALRVGSAGASDADNAASAIARVAELSTTVGTAKSLGELGGTDAHVEQLTNDALADLMILSTPRYPSRAQVSELYASVL